MDPCGSAGTEVVNDARDRYPAIGPAPGWGKSAPGSLPASRTKPDGSPGEADRGAQARRAARGEPSNSTFSLAEPIPLTGEPLAPRLGWSTRATNG
jgi:hypothetical protein